MNPPIRVLHIIKSLGRGGAEKLLPETLKIHDRNRFEFHYAYFLPWKNQLVDDIRDNGGIVNCFRANNNLQLLTRVPSIVRYVRENKIQIIHAHLPWAGILARIVGKLCSLPVIYTEHNKQERYHIATRIMNLATLNMSTTLIAVSQDVADSVYKHKPGYKPTIRTVVNGVNTDHFNPAYFDRETIRKNLRIPSDAFVVGTVSVFRFQKRLDLWMDLAFEISKKCANAQFIIVGDGPLRADLMKKRIALGLEGKIHMPGLETDVRPYLASFDIYMMSSIFEGLPVALLEAMSMACPIISTNAGGIGEVISNNIHGLLCAVDEPEKLVDYALSLIRNPKLILGYKEESRKRVLEAFSMGKMVRELEGIYNEIASKT